MKLSDSESYNEEQELSQERMEAWVKHFGMAKFQCHCSGHARGKDLIKAVSDIDPKIIFPIHTENPEVFGKKIPNTVMGKEFVKYYL
ncbi:MAG: MBL fold metallo-hydrolase RNA specificity domain-containing protein [Nitrososphaeraceae archaeon]